MSAPYKRLRPASKPRPDQTAVVGRYKGTKHSKKTLNGKRTWR